MGQTHFHIYINNVSEMMIATLPCGQHTHTLIIHPPNASIDKPVGICIINQSICERHLNKCKHKSIAKCSVAAYSSSSSSPSSASVANCCKSKLIIDVNLQLHLPLATCHLPPMQLVLMCSGFAFS